MKQDIVRRLEPLIFVGAFFGLVGGSVAMIFGTGWAQAGGIVAFMLGCIGFGWATEEFDRTDQ